MRRCCTRRTIKWICLALSVLLSVGWAVSLFRLVGYIWQDCTVWLGEGGFGYDITTNMFTGWVSVPSTGHDFLPEYVVDSLGTRLKIPFWIPLLITAIPTFIMWRSQLAGFLRSVRKWWRFQHKKAKAATLLACMSGSIWLFSCVWGIGTLRQWGAISLGGGCFHIQELEYSAQPKWFVGRSATVRWKPSFYYHPSYELDLPLWIPTLLFAVTTLLMTRTPKPGFCTTCEYNLTGNTSGVCPECGTSTGDG